MPTTSRLMFALTLLAALLPGAASAATPDLGQKAPDFSLNTTDGHPVTLASLTGKGTVVLVVLRGYPGYQCPFCVKQVHDFIQNADRFAAANARVLLVYPGPSADLDQHAREALARQNPLPANIQLVVDPDYTMTTQYELRWDAPQETAYPSTFVIDRHNVVVFRKISKVHSGRTSATDVLTLLAEHPSR